MVRITARKIRSQNRRSSYALHQCDGFLLKLPLAGQGMVIFRGPHGHRMITTSVRRVLSATDGISMYVETENSVYRIDVHDPTVTVHPPAVAH